jgi:hypothetical protein
MKYRQAIIVILLSDIFHLDTGSALNPRFFLGVMEVSVV